MAGVITAVTSERIGGTTTVNEVIVRELLIFPSESVTVIVQSEYVPSLNVFRVIVLFPATTIVVLEEQGPSYVMVPASVDEKV